MKTILISTLVGLLLVAIIGLATQNFCLSWQMDNLEKQADTIFAEGRKAGYDYIKSVEEFQKQIGANPDGFWGKESKEKHRLAYGQQSANVWINNKSMRIDPSEALAWGVQEFEVKQ